MSLQHSRDRAAHQISMVVNCVRDARWTRSLRVELQLSSAGCMAASRRQRPRVGDVGK